MCSVAVVHLHVRLDAHLNGVIGYDTQTVGTSVDTFRVWVSWLIPTSGVGSQILLWHVLVLQSLSTCYPMLCSVAVVLLHVRLDAHLNGVIGYDTHTVGTSVDILGSWISRTYSHSRIVLVILSHRGTGFLNPFLTSIRSGYPWFGSQHPFPPLRFCRRELLRVLLLFPVHICKHWTSSLSL
jgi:hypothetical protein